jgi:sporadic carbohydrate cluster 2OG-Fe(II) oxygenase
MNKIINKGHMGSTIKFLSKEDRILFLKDFYSPCKMNQLFSSWNYKGNYNLVDIKFKEAIVEELVSKKFVDEKIFCKENYKLEKLHLCLNSDNKSLDESEQNKISISFYETSKILSNLYVEFIKNTISPLFDEKIFYQKVPTFRFHFPNQEGYNWNDRYHTDTMLGHPPYEHNIWVPFTKTFGSNSMRITPYDESIGCIKSCYDDFEKFAERTQYDKKFMEYLRKNSYSLEMSYGEYIIFDSRCLHCTQYNDTNETRISMDIRIIRESEIESYSRSYITTGRKKMPFLPGHYFSNLAV